MIKNKKFSFSDNIVILIGLVVGSLFIQGVLMILLQVIFKEWMSPLTNAITVCIALLIATLFCPYLIMRKIVNCPMTELGFKKPTRHEIFIAVFIVVTGIFVAWMLTRQWEAVLIISLHNIFIAFSEEFIARGCMFAQLRRIYQKDWFVLIISTLIFVFVFHSNAPLIENLIWRLPVSIVLTLTYFRTKNLLLCTSIHFAYNVIVSFAVK